MNQQELADLVGVHKITISRWERGIESPTTPNLLLIANTLGVSLSKFENNNIINSMYYTASTTYLPYCNEVQIFTYQANHLSLPPN